MQEWIEGLPLILAIAFFWSGAMMRGSMIYGIGRAAAAGGQRAERIRLLMETPAYQKAAQFVNTWGVFAVPLCYLTVGFQTAVLMTTGFTRMPLSRWIPGMVIGSFIWGVIYGTVGMAVVWAWLEQPIVVALTISLVAVAILFFVLYRLRKHRAKVARQMQAVEVQEIVTQSAE